MKLHKLYILFAFIIIIPLSACDDANSQLNPCLDNSNATLLTPGIPFQSDTEDGGSVIGTASIDSFEADGDRIKANGTFTCGDTTFDAEYPVKVIDSNCESLILEIGPPSNPPGLISTTEIGPGTGLTTGSELRLSDLCDISAANKSGDMEQLADELNETEKIEMGAVQSCCPWYKALECSFAIITCMRVCSITPPPAQACLDCLSSAGSVSCACCL